MRIRAVAAVLLLVCVGSLPAGPAQAQGTEQLVYVTVLAKDGVPIDGLGPDYFAVREDGRDRAVVRVEPASVPMHIAVLVDTSTFVDSEAEPYRAAILAFLTRMAVNNEVALYDFGERAQVMIPFTRDAAALAAAVARISAHPITTPRLIDAVDQACGDLRAAEARRPVVVAVTIAGAEASTKAAGPVVKRLIKEGVSLHVVAATRTIPIATPSLTSSAGRNEAERFGRLNQLTSGGEGNRERSQLIEEGTAKTAGELQRVTSLLAVGGALQRVGGQLTATYQLTFTRPGRGAPRNLQVGVMLEDVVLRAIAAPTK